MKSEIREIKNKEDWDSFVLRQTESSLLQTWQWKNFLELEGVPTYPFFILQEDQVVAAALFAKISLPAGQHYLYAPRGPIFKDDLNASQRETVLSALIRQVEELAPSGKPIFLRFDPALSEEDLNPSKVGLRKSVKDMQPRHTSIVYLGVSEEEIIRNMKSSTRYSVRNAYKKGASVTVAKNEDDVKKFYDLLRLTAERGGFFIYPESHYLNLWRALAPNNIRLYLAEAEGEVIAGTMIVWSGNKSIYLHSASDYEKRSYLAPYLLQSQAIKDMKQDGVLYYDLWGVAPKGAGKEHPWYGITFFKKGLGGNYTEHMGTYDFVLRPLWYRLFKLGRATVRFVKGRKN